MRSELNNDITLQLETDYGRIRMQVGIGNNIATRYLICYIRNYRILTKGGVEVRPARKHNELLKRYDAQRPFCPKAYKEIGSINLHIYKKKRQRTHIKENIQTINWEDVWEHICLANNPTVDLLITNPTNSIDILENEPSSSSNSES